MANVLGRSEMETGNFVEALHDLIGERVRGIPEELAEKLIRKIYL